MPDFKPWQWATLIALLAALNIVVIGGLILVVATYDLWANADYLAAEPTAAPWATPRATLRPTFTPTFTPEVWPTATATRTPTQTPPPTVTWTPLPTRTPRPTDTPTSTTTPAPPPTLTPTPTFTWTLAPTSTPSATATSAPPTPTATLTPVPPPTLTSTSTPTPVPSPTRAPTPTFTWTPIPTASPSATSSPSPSATSTPIPSPTGTATRAPVVAAQPATPSATPSPSPSPTHTPLPSATHTATPSASATHTATASPSATHTATPWPTATDTPTPSPSPTSSTTPTASSTATPTPAPTPTGTATPTAQISALSPQPVQAVSLTETSISLAWGAVAQAMLYRVYSDMGTGYGVYAMKGETTELGLMDSGLRAGARYVYRVTSVTPSGEAASGWAQAITPGGADFQGRAHSPAASADHSPAAIAIQPSPASIRVTPAPTPLPPDTVILGLLSSADYLSQVDNTMTIVGEVRNDSHLDVGETTVAATLYGSDGQPIDEVSGTTLLSALSPGVRSPFAITLSDPARVANYSLRATGRPITMAAGDGQLNVITTRRFEDPAGFYHVAGVIENPGGRRVEQARVIVTLYDRGGRVVNVGFAYPQPPSLSAGERADFDVAFTYYPKVYSHAAMAAED